MTQDSILQEVLEYMIPLIHPKKEDFYSKAMDIFDYIDAICSLAETINNSKVVPLLKKLQNHCELMGLMCSDILETEDWMKERKAFLELRIAKALAICDYKHGYQILIDYLDDIRTILSDYAYKTLKVISGKNFKKKRTYWEEWLSNEKV